jgi:hypothetical protein
VAVRGVAKALFKLRGALSSAHLYTYVYMCYIFLPAAFNQGFFTSTPFSMVFPWFFRYSFDLKRLILHTLMAYM